MPKKVKAIHLPQLSLLWNLTASHLSSIKLETLLVIYYDDEYYQVMNEWNSSNISVCLILIFQVKSTTGISFGKEFRGIAPCWAIKLCNTHLLAD